jgi:uncharacterized protein (DUF924 family)
MLALRSLARASPSICPAARLLFAPAARPAPRPAASAASAASAAAAAAAMHPRAQSVLDFWFGPGWEAAPPTDTRAEKMGMWFSGKPELDAEIVAAFGADCEALLRGEYDAWAAPDAEPAEALAAILVGDQLARNAFRDTPKMFAADEKTLAWALALADSGRDKALTPVQRVFAYMPLM